MKHKTLRTLLCVILTVCFCLSAIVPASAAGLFGGDSGAATGWDQLIRGLKDRFIEKNPGTDETPAEPMAGAGDEFIRIFHLDCGRKYFTVQQIKDIIDQLEENHYTHIELAIGNDALRFLLDDMNVEVNGSTYSSDAVKAGIQKGNLAYTKNSTGELTQTEMTSIIDYAKSKKIGVIPLLNSPGHMDSIIDCMESLGMRNVAFSVNLYGTSERTIDVANSNATAFTQALITKYVSYFAKQGCEYFNLGADEYANDKLVNYSGMGFGYLVKNGGYDKFVEYVNNVAGIITDAKMTPMAFNDGIYYAKTEISNKPFAEEIVVAYWTAGGWNGYNVAPASFLAGKGHKIINTNDGWYYVLGRNSGTYGWYNNKTSSVKYYDTPSSYTTPNGCMLAVWCDNPEAEYNANEQTRLNTMIKNLADNNKEVFKAPPAPTISGAPTEAMVIGSSVKLSVSDDAVATWTVDNENVLELKAVAENVSVAAEGLVQASSVIATAIASGEATVTATTADGETASATIQVYSETSTALTATSINLEYWITNYPVYDGNNTNTNHTQTITTSTAGATDNDGIAIAEIAPNPAYSFFDGTVTVYYWQAMRLDAANQQTEASGDDETADGTTLTHVRYQNGAWQYKTVDGTWHYFMAGDQLVAYYLQKTTVTEEVDTYMKDWGYDTTKTTENTSGGKGQVALTVAVVYPDGTVSPAESTMYSSSTVIYTFQLKKDGTWVNRDIGIVAPVNNSDYTISKITVTDGTRDSNSSANVWYTTDTITWEKENNEAGDEWYKETVVWDKVTNAGTTPMVNGKNSNITWSAKNTGKLVLIYLEAIEKPDNLTVIYYDDNAGAEITRVPVVVGNGVTFKTHLKDGSGNVIGGTMNWPAETAGEGYLPDDAYVTNTSGVNQTFSKQISTLQNISSVYKSGIYKYVSANIDANDDKILILHFDLKNADASSFVVDFGLPITILPGDIGITNTTTIQKASLTKATSVLSNKGNYGTATIAGDYSNLTYTLHRPLDKIATIPLFVTFEGGDQQEFQINIIPATNVYYEENFINVAENSTVWTDTGTARNPDQTLEKSDAQKYVYGYDPEYATATDTYSMGNAKKAALTLSADAFSTKTSEALTFTFEGDGYDIISECGTDVGLLVAYTYRVENGKETLKYIDIMDNYFCGDDTYITGDGILAAQVPVIRKLNLSDGYGKYKVKIIGYLRQTAGVLNVSDSMAAQSYAAMASVDSPVVYDYESSTNAIVDEILADLGVANLADVDVRVSFVDKNSILNGGTGVFAKETVQDMKNDLRSAYTVQANEGYKAGSAVVYVDAFRVYNPLGHDTTNLPTAYSDANENDMRYDSVYEYVSASGADIGDDYIENSAVYVEYDGNKGIATISEYKKQGPENEVYLTANGSKEQHFIGFVINGWEKLANRKLIVSAKIVSGEPSLVTRDAGSNESVVAVSDLPDPGQKQLSKTEQYFDLTDHVINIGGKWVLIIGNKSDGSSVLSISGIRIKNKCTAGTTLEDVNIITGIISSESGAEFTPVKFSETHKSKVRVNKSAYISINASDDVTSFKLYAVNGNTKTEVTDDFTYDWTNQKAFNAGRTDIKSYSAYVKVGATAGEKKYELVAVNANNMESNPIEITITVVQ